MRRNACLEDFRTCRNADLAYSGLGLGAVSRSLRRRGTTPSEASLQGSLGHLREGSFVEQVIRKYCEELGVELDD